MKQSEDCRMPEMPFRQVHLDFHTSPLIPDVGRDFHPAEFSGTLVQARVNSVTVFAKCHHGCSYYDTKVGVKHPSLTRDLLGEMIEACHARGIRAPIYYSVMWDEWAAEHHPEWLLRRQDGSPSRPPLEPGWRTLCINTPYADYIAESTREICDNYPVDGLFFDIIFPASCYCNRCLESMRKEGLDPALATDQYEFRVALIRGLMERMNGIAAERSPDATVYYNSIPPFQWRRYADLFSHFEIECLPRGGWGYDFFPLSVRRASVFGKPMLGMTGRFLESWGHFGSLSPRASLEYECASALSHGAACSIGDQLHPRGRLDKDVYDLIGSVYEQVAEKEEWCAGSRPVVELAVLSKNDGTRHPADFPEGDLGAMKMLTQCQYQFDVVDRLCDFTPYRVLVLPDDVPVDGETVSKIDRYVESGGRILCTHRGGTAPDGGGFAPRAMSGVRVLGDAPYSPDYLILMGAWADGLPSMPVVAYERGLRVEAGPGWETLATRFDPYFQRTWEHFCSHFHTPVDRDSGEPAVLASDSCVYITHPLFASYHRHGYIVYRDIVTRCLDRLLGRRLLESNLPRSARATLMKQPGGFIVHVLHYVPEGRTPRFDIVEDVTPLFGVEVSVAAERKPSRVYLAPQREDLPFEFADGRVRVEIAEVRGHQMVVFEEMKVS